MQIDLLEPGDEQAVEAFLVDRLETSIFLLSNMRAAGLAYHGKPLEGVYVAVREGDEIAALACHAWNNNLLVQAPTALDEVVRGCVERSGRPVHGILGPWDQAERARAALGLSDTTAQMCSKEILFALDLDALIVPGPLASGELRCRQTTADDIALVADWRVSYRVETLGDADTAAVRVGARVETEQMIARRDSFLLERDGEPVAHSAFNARLPDLVQVGGVWTPPALRNRGYGRAVVAGSLLAAAEAGATRAILFTDEHNPAQRTYAAIGFRPIGDYGIILFQ